MKKQVRLIFAFATLTFAVLTTTAQDIFFTAKSATASKVVNDRWEELDVPIYFHNNTADTLLMSWKLQSHSLPEGWEIGICDNSNCYYNVNNSLYNPRESAPIKPYDSIFLKAVFSPRFLTGSGEAEVVVEAYPKNQPGKTTEVFRDTLTYFGEATANPNSINDLTNGENIQVFPTATSTDVFVKGLMQNIAYNIDVMDMQGRVFTSTPVINSSQVTVNTSQLAAGMYLLRISDKNTHSFAVRTFIKQ